MSPAAPLQDGEYCLFYGAGGGTYGTTGLAKLFDFGVDARSGTQN